MDINAAVIEGRKIREDAGFLASFLDTEVFIELLNAPANLGTGQLTTQQKDDLSLRFAQIREFKMAVFHTTSEVPNLTGQLAGISLRAAAELAIGSDEVHGLLLQSNTEAWFAITNDALSAIVSNSPR